MNSKIIEEISKELGITHLSFETAMNNLERCQILNSLDYNDNEGNIKKDITALGIVFISACIAD